MIAESPLRGISISNSFLSTLTLSVQNQICKFSNSIISWALIYLNTEYIWPMNVIYYKIVVLYIYRRNRSCKISLKSLYLQCSVAMYWVYTSHHITRWQLLNLRVKWSFCCLVSRHIQYCAIHELQIWNKI
jgi:hypothetical protein